MIDPDIIADYLDRTPERPSISYRIGRAVPFVLVLLLTSSTIAGLAVALAYTLELLWKP